jgi:acetyl-CoA C-acetyltransferase
LAGNESHRSSERLTMTGTVITAARRTAVGSFMGAFGSVPAHELGKAAMIAAMADAGVSADEIDEGRC